MAPARRRTSGTAPPRDWDWGRSCASINGRGGPLSYSATHHRWQKYCVAAGVDIEIHQLRHAHATELINSGVSIEVVRRR
ncbi:tyrosine-type recombinase/integrase [Nocardia salmonicida]|uniref:tyrosine-type recombinase/integrase n=1 Tax=Nocardia salmonicida TaxID=53431 RepID=UPI00378E040D